MNKTHLQSVRAEIDAAYRADFIDGYIACALWSSTDIVDGKDVNLDDPGIGPLDESVRAQMEKDCDSFIAQNKEDLRDIDASQAGHDFWLTRNGHGAGFFDRGLGNLGARLTAACHKFREVNLYVGDDGRIYC